MFWVIIGAGIVFIVLIIAVFESHIPSSFIPPCPTCGRLRGLRLPDPLGIYNHTGVCHRCWERRDRDLRKPDSE